MKHDTTLALPPAFADALGIPRAPRSVVEGLISMMIEDLDQMDGDDDLEDNMMEDDFTPAERLALYADGPGCSISDCDKGAEDEGEITYEEWHTLPSSIRRAGRLKGNAMPGRYYLDDDAEEDDPAGVEASEDEPDMRGVAASHGPGCSISDPDGCNAGEDRGTHAGGFRLSDGAPGDPDDAEEGGDTELNGDEGDHSEGDI